MASATPLPTLPFDYKTWKAGTSITLPPLFDKTARAKFDALDRAVDVYTTKATPSALVVLRAALRDWMDHKDDKDGPGAWAESKRNRKYLIAHLNAAIHGDTDVSLGMPEMMSPGMINARLGILYLFANTTWDEGVFRFVTSGVLDFAGKGDGKPAVRALKASDWLVKPGPAPTDAVRKGSRPTRSALVIAARQARHRHRSAVAETGRRQGSGEEPSGHVGRRAGRHAGGLPLPGR